MSEGVLGRLEKAIDDAMRTGILIPAVHRELLVDAYNEIAMKDEEIRLLKSAEKTEEFCETQELRELTAEEKFNEIIESKKDKLIEAALKSLEPFEMRDVVAQQKETIDRQNEEIRALVSGQITLQNHLASVIRKETAEEFSRILLSTIKEHHYWLMDVNNTQDRGMFTIGIEQAVAETIKELERGN